MDGIEWNIPRRVTERSFIIANEELILECKREGLFMTDIYASISEFIKEHDLKIKISYDRITRAVKSAESETPKSQEEESPRKKRFPSPRNKPSSLAKKEESSNDASSETPEETLEKKCKALLENPRRNFGNTKYTVDELV